MSKEFDVVVVGAGHNGLVTAGYLAKAGLKVCVVEKNSFPGGSTNTQEVTLPGFKHDVGATFHVWIQSNPLIANDELGLISKFGLEYVTPPAYSSNVFPDGTALVVYSDVNKTCEEIAQYSPEDAVAYRKFFEKTAPLIPLLQQGMFNPALSYGPMMAQFESFPEGKWLADCMFKSCWDVAHDWFKHPKTLMKVMKTPTEAMVAPEEKGTGLLLPLMLTASHLVPAKMGKGGTVALINALLKCIDFYGGTVQLNSEVVKIKTSGNKVTGVILASGEEINASKAVISNVHPKLSINKWLDSGLVDDDIRSKVDRIQQASYSGLYIAAAMDKRPEFKAGPNVNDGGFIEFLPDNLDDFRALYDDLKYGRLPSKERMSVMVCIPTEFDPSRAPEGKHVLYAWQYVPYNLADGGPKKWAEVKEGFADQMMEQFFSYTTNMSEKDILKRTVLSRRLVQYEQQCY